MAKHDPHYRANPERAIYVTEALTEGLIARIAPQILQLRKSSAEPVTVYINSPGGSIRVLYVLDGLLHSRDADERTNRVVTVALGDADSAAATLLALGDYAIAYKHSRMHFHGIRYPVVEELTAEAASDSAGSLSRSNRTIAMRLAKVVLERLILRYISLQPEFSAPLSPIASFVNCLKHRVSNAGDKLLDQASMYMGRLENVSAALKGAGIQGTDEHLERDAKVFRAILEFEIAQHKTQDWCLDEFGVQEVVTDYFLLRDYSFGEHNTHLENVIDSYGPSFLSVAQFTEYAKKHDADAAAAKAWLRPLVEDDARQFWYFTVCLCRFMQEGENPLNSADAYWLGVVDEVLGSDMIGARHFVERDSPSSSSV